MKDTQDSFFLHITDEIGPRLQILHTNVKHMAVMYGIVRDIRTCQIALLLKNCQMLIIIVKNLTPLVVDLVHLEQLCIQIGRVHIAWQIRGAVADPRILIDLSTEKFTPIRTLFTQDLCTLQISIILKQQRAALSHCIILCLMEAVAAEISDRAERTPFIPRIDTLRCILHDLQVVFFCNRHDRIHLTGDTGIMHRHNDLCALCDCRLDLRLINIHCLWMHIYKYNFGTLQHKCICRGYKRVGRHDHLISRLQITEKRCHLQGMCAGSRQKNMLCPELLLHQL